MSKEQIEEMAREITDVWNNKCQFVACNGCKYNDLNDNRCQEKLIADHLVSKGYRKQSEGVWKFNRDGSGTCSECHFTQRGVWDYDNHQNFCGVCGAKMKGGE